MIVDIASDLHVDRWPGTIDWSKNKKSDIIIVAGDISDDINDTVKVVNKLTDIYEHVLFIEGNHEYQKYFPDLEYTPNFLKRNLSPKVQYLFDKIYIIGDTAFVAQCGWWNFEFGEPIVHRDISRNEFVKVFSEEMAEKILKEAVSHTNWLSMWVDKLQYDDNISKIVVFTHSLPHQDLLSWDIYPESRNNVGNYGNTLYKNVFKSDIKNKIKLWVFGHNHDSKDKIIENIHMVSNPRGKPRDFNKSNWKQITIEI